MVYKKNFRKTFQIWYNIWYIIKKFFPVVAVDGSMSRFVRMGWIHLKVKYDYFQFNLVYINTLKLIVKLGPVKPVTGLFGKTCLSLIKVSAFFQSPVFKNAKWIVNSQPIVLLLILTKIAEIVNSSLRSLEILTARIKQLGCSALTSLKNRPGMTLIATWLTVKNKKIFVPNLTFFHFFRSNYNRRANNENIWVNLEPFSLYIRLLLLPIGARALLQEESK